MVFESVKELSKNLVLGFLTGLNIWMLLGIVGLSDIVDVKLAGLVRVDNFVSFQGHIFSERVHLTTDDSQELFIADLTTAISIEDGEAFGHLSVVHSDSEIVHSFLEFRFIQ